jgi:acyl-CoA synthetase (AMP-forming)/AMP-acid ligase II
MIWQMTSEWIGKVPRDLSTPTGPALNQARMSESHTVRTPSSSSGVALWAPSSCQWAVASLAVLFAGGTLVPVRTVPTLSALASGSPA